MHLILSNITAIQSTAGILALHSELPEDRRARFTANIHSESERLTKTAKELVAYLDNPEAQPVMSATRLPRLRRYGRPSAMMPLFWKPQTMRQRRKNHNRINRGRVPVAP